MNQLLLPRFKRLMEPASWRDLSVGQAWGAISGLCHGFALLTLLPAASALATGMPVWGLSFWGWLIVLAVIAVLGVGTEFYAMRTGYIGSLGFIHDVHQAVGNKVARLPLGAFDSGSSGRLSRMVTQEMMNLGESAVHFRPRPKTLGRAGSHYRHVVLGLAAGSNLDDRLPDYARLPPYLPRAS